MKFSKLRLITAGPQHKIYIQDVQIQKLFLLKPLLLACLFLQFSCGTVAGNPKKPTNPPSGAVDQPEISPEAQVKLNQMKLPLVGLDIGDTTADDLGVGLNLLLSDAAPSGKKERIDDYRDSEVKDTIDENDPILNGWSKRLERIVDNMNTVSRAVNHYLEKSEADLDMNKARIRKKVPDQRISAVIEKMPGEGAATYRAQVCFAGRIGAQILWDESLSKITFIRDMRTKVQDPDEDIPLTSQLIIEKEEQGIRYKLATSGKWNGFRSSAGDGTNSVDYTESFANKNGIIDLKYVSDSFEVLPPNMEFEGDTYLVGRIHPTAFKASSGKSRTKKEFVAYHKSFAKTFCKNGFDEASATLWSPKPNEPRFCLGRPLGAARFKNYGAFLDTLTSLQPIGLASKKNLSLPEFAPLGENPCD